MENNFNLFIKPIYNKNTIYQTIFTSQKTVKENVLNIAKKFEGLFLNIILKNMRNSLPKNDLFNNETKSMYENIYDQTISEQISKKGFGLADIIAKQILRNNILK